MVVVEAVGESTAAQRHRWCSHDVTGMYRPRACFKPAPSTEGSNYQYAKMNAHREVHAGHEIEVNVFCPSNHAIRILMLFIIHMIRRSYRDRPNSSRRGHRARRPPGAAARAGAASQPAAVPHTGCGRPALRAHRSIRAALGSSSGQRRIQCPCRRPARHPRLPGCASCHYRTRPRGCGWKF